MKYNNLAIKVKDLRTRKGYTQEQLSEHAKLSLRTIQRIEKGESVPRGDTLVKLTNALEVTPDDLLEFTDIEDKGYLTLLHSSALSFMIHPLLGIVIPLAMWILKREKIKGVEHQGKNLINFQISFSILLYAVILTATKGSFISINFGALLKTIPTLLNSFSIWESIALLLFLYNTITVLLNLIRVYKEKKIRYWPAIPFLK